MKAKKMTRQLALLAFSALLSTFMFNACSDVAGPGQSESEIISQETGQLMDNRGNGNGNSNRGNNNGNNNNNNQTDETSSSEIFTEVCYAGGSAELKASNSSHHAGTVDFSIEDGQLIVVYNAADGVTISETHLWAGTDIKDMPSAGNGAPRNGHFPYGGSYGGETTLLYTIPLESIGYSDGDNIVVVAHAVVNGSNEAEFSGGETAYAGDEKGDSPRWFWYFEISEFDECEEEFEEASLNFRRAARW